MREGARHLPSGLLLTTLGLSLVARLAGADPLPDAAALVERMQRATVELNYDGVALYQRGSDIRTVRIVHRGGDDEAERIVALDGPPREVVRDGRHVTCVYADNQSVMVDKRQPRNPLAFGNKLSSDALARHYAVNTVDTERVAGRTTYVVAIEPRESTRYGYRLWIDQDKGLLMKSAVVDVTGQVLEQTRFTHIEFPEHVPAELLKAQFTDQAFAWYSYQQRPRGAAIRPPQDTAEQDAWRVTWLPRGFSMRDEAEEQLIDHDFRVSHRVYTDGLAMVSVFVEPAAGPPKSALGYSSLGAINTFSRVQDGYKVTVVGELPRTTISRIAASVEARQ